MRTQTVAHLSDLHIGSGPKTDDAVLRLREALVGEGVDHVIVTGDVTHRGRVGEVERFWRLVQPAGWGGKVTVIPGNHDRLGDDVRDLLMDGPRVQVEDHEGLYLVRLDSTGEHNRRWIDPHGGLTLADLRAVDTALDRAPGGALCALLLHHHPLPLPEEHPFESLVTWAGWPNARELYQGRQLLDVLRGRCDLVLHGHRHVPAEATLFPDSVRSLRLFNAGSTTELERFRVFEHRDGALRGEPAWVSFDRTRAPSPIPAPIRWPWSTGGGRVAPSAA
jgi:3',5'-cyclic AMP phosphodiesterase CpdA